MKRFGHRLAWVVAVSLCCSLFAVPLQATETEKDEETQKVVKESPLVKASREIQAKKTGTTKTYSNEDLAESQPTSKVYTNEDLSRKYGSTEASQETPAAPARPPASGSGRPQNMPDPLELMEQEKASQAERTNRIEAAEGALAAAQQKLKSLEVQSLAASNPFSARPKLSEEEQEQRLTSGEGAAERKVRTDQMVAEAREEVAKAEADLANARGQ